MAKSYKTKIDMLSRILYFTDKEFKKVRKKAHGQGFSCLEHYIGNQIANGNMELAMKVLDKGVPAMTKNQHEHGINPAQFEVLKAIGEEMRRITQLELKAGILERMTQSDRCASDPAPALDPAKSLQPQTGDNKEQGQKIVDNSGHPPV